MKARAKSDQESKINIPTMFTDLDFLGGKFHITFSSSLSDYFCVRVDLHLDGIIYSALMLLCVLIKGVSEAKEKC